MVSIYFEEKCTVPLLCSVGFDLNSVFQNLLTSFFPIHFLTQTAITASGLIIVI
jgi:hypothetical protein